MTTSFLTNIIRHFNLDNPINIKPLGDGLINVTYQFENEGERYVLQEINTNVFPNVGILSSNVDIITNFLTNKTKYNVLQFIQSDTGKSFYEHNNHFYRISRYIDCCSIPPNLDTIEKAGEAFSEYERILSELPTGRLKDVLPRFHDLDYRLEQLEEAIESDKVGRVKEVKNELDFIELYKQKMMKIQYLKNKGIIPKRIAHCDTKVNNILFSNDGNVLCVIDLDTTREESILSDYGDFLRTAANNGKEDDQDLSKVSFNMDVFKSFTNGYLKQSGWLVSNEIKYLPHSILYFPFIQAIRFLTDYINGDQYYVISYPNHNLIRSRSQIALCKSIALHFNEIKQYIYNQSILKINSI